MVSKRLLLVVDMLNDFVRADGALYCGSQVDKIVPRVLELVNDFYNQGEPIVFIMDSHAPDDIEFNRFPVHSVQGTTGAKLIRELEDVASQGQNIYRVTKNRYSSFYNTDLDDIIATQAPDEVHVVGVCTNICVLYTVEELCNRDYKVLVYRDGVTSFDLQAHDWSLGQMETVLGAIIV